MSTSKYTSEIEKILGMADKVLQETSSEERKSVLAKIESYGIEGPTYDEYLASFDQEFKIDTNKSGSEYSNWIEFICGVYSENFVVDQEAKIEWYDVYEAIKDRHSYEPYWLVSPPEIETTKTTITKKSLTKSEALFFG